MLPAAPNFATYQPRLTGAAHDPLFAVIESALERFLRDARECDRALPGFSCKERGFCPSCGGTLG